MSWMCFRIRVALLDRPIRTCLFDRIPLFRATIMLLASAMALAVMLQIVLVVLVVLGLPISAMLLAVASDRTARRLFVVQAIAIPLVSSCTVFRLTSMPLANIVRLSDRLIASALDATLIGVEALVWALLKVTARVVVGFASVSMVGSVKRATTCSTVGFRLDYGRHSRWMLLPNLRIRVLFGFCDSITFFVANCLNGVSVVIRVGVDSWLAVALVATVGVASI